MKKEFVQNLFDVKGKVIVVTGATGALGQALCYGYGFAGAKVVLNGRKEDSLKPVYEDMKSQGIECTYFAGDPAKEEDVKGLMAKAVEAFGE